MADDDNLFSVQVLAPDRVLLTGQAEQVIMRTEDGDITFLDGHTPLVGAVVPCVVRVVRQGEEEERLAVHGGFVQVEQLEDAERDDDSARAGGSGGGSGDTGTRVTVLASVAELSDEIDTERARASLEAAQTRVTDLTAASGRGSSAEGDEADAELVEAQSAVLRAEVRLEASGATAAAS
jgi:F-type H+-transporting ATPase subunit epsilon